MADPESPPTDPAPAKRNKGGMLGKYPADRLCGAKTRQGGLCMNVCVTGRKRCRMHGGSSPVGMASPSFKHGRSSLHCKLPKGLSESYAKAQSDPELLSLRSGVALVETRLAQLAEALGTRSPRELWDSMVEAVGRMRAAREARDGQGVLAAMSDIEAAITAGGQQADAWDDVFDCLRMKKEMASAEWRRLVDLRQIITEERAFLLVTAITEAVMRNVPDPVVRNKIAVEIGRLVESGDAKPHGNPEAAFRQLQEEMAQDASDMEAMLAGAGEDGQE